MGRWQGSLGEKEFYKKIDVSIYFYCVPLNIHNVLANKPFIYLKLFIDLVPVL